MKLPLHFSIKIYVLHTPMKLVCGPSETVAQSIAPFTFRIIFTLIVLPKREILVNNDVTDIEH